MLFDEEDVRMWRNVEDVEGIEDVEDSGMSRTGVREGCRVGPCNAWI